MLTSHQRRLRVRRVLLLSLAMACGFVLSVKSDVRFTDATDNAGIRFTPTDGRSGQKFYLETLGAGAAWFDYDRDGNLDIYFVNGADLPGMKSDTPPTNALYRNNGDGTFTDVTAQAGVGDTGYGFSCAVADFDNDGWQDLYVANYGANVLYRNNGDGTFTDITAQSGVGDTRWAAAAAFADPDRDGDLDLFVANYVEFNTDENPECLRLGVRMHCSPDVFQGQPNVYYRNNGDGTFTDITHESGLYSLAGKGMGVIWCDYDNDGDPDLYVANDRTANMLWRNNGSGAFEEVALMSGVALDEMGRVQSSMAVVAGDVDNDGAFDFALTNFEDEPNNLYRNVGGGFFADETYSSGLGEKSLPYLAWGAEFGDFDQDGYLDFLVVNGHIDENIRDAKPNSSYDQSNQLFLNRGDETFSDVSNQVGDDFAAPRSSRGIALGDYDNDGDLDLLITNSNQPAQLLRNDSERVGNWLIVALEGVADNRDAVGARVRVEVGGKSQIREVKSGGSYPSHSDMRLHFGVGAAETVDLVEVRWLDGTAQRIESVASNRVLHVRQTPK
ncbi:MAG: CRTAC1 family protein [Candidatus Poribacteria bacterium]|nr:CRTAC1 family protein [Candidatus Poribacteria bacterium]